MEILKVAEVVRDGAKMVVNLFVGNGMMTMLPPMVI